MKKRLRVIIFLLVLNLCLSIPKVIAYMIRQDVEKNTLIPAQVTCEVLEEYETVEIPVVGGTKEVELETTKTSIKIENTSSVAAYIRLRLVHYYADTKGVPVGKNSVLEGLSINYGSNPAAPLWIYDANNYTYYYTKVLQPGESTEDLLASDLVLKQGSSSFQGVVFYYNQTLEVHAEAIQAKPIDAITESWPVNITGTTITSLK